MLSYVWISECKDVYYCTVYKHWGRGERGRGEVRRREGSRHVWWSYESKLLQLTKNPISSSLISYERPTQNLKRHITPYSTNTLPPRPSRTAQVPESSIADPTESNISPLSAKRSCQKPLLHTAQDGGANEGPLTFDQKGEEEISETGEAVSRPRLLQCIIGRLATYIVDEANGAWCIGRFHWPTKTSKEVHLWNSYAIKTVYGSGGLEKKPINKN